MVKFINLIDVLGQHVNFPKKYISIKFLTFRELGEKY